MAEQETGIGLHPAQRRGDRELVGQEAARSRRVDHEISPQSLQHFSRHDGAIAVFHTGRHRGAYEVVVDVGA